MRTVREVARFVSMIPFLDDWHVDGESTDMWCLSHEFLELRAGDWEEHAILLVNYILHLKKPQKDVYLLTGEGANLTGCRLVLCPSVVCLVRPR